MTLSKTPTLIKTHCPWPFHGPRTHARYSGFAVIAMPLVSAKTNRRLEMPNFDAMTAAHTKEIRSFILCH